ncbi:hypothetical protein A9Q81_26020 [Gammaproteobacteria bacterium 42_54_T18]|nr:hypothetical protein A9Q81_26020 [Gammaproteobacteria bacterium 42_54_T18]
MSCIFCNIEQTRIIDQDAFFFVIRDGYPVTEGHSLFIPHRHALTWFDLTAEEQTALNALLTKQKKLLQEADNTITGFNIGMNCGEDAGQSVMHCHVHLIPRRKGDMEDPRDGVRGVIPHKQKY